MISEQEHQVHIADLQGDSVSQEFGVRTIWKLALTYQVGWS
jgi:hypothetical protein